MSESNAAELPPAPPETSGDDPRDFSGPSDPPAPDGGGYEGPSYEPPPPYGEPRHASARPLHRSPFIAGALSFVLPGLGNLYNGLMQRGLLTFAVGVSLFFSAAHAGGGEVMALLVPSMLFVWLFGILDAVRQATLINYGVTEADLSSRPSPASGGSVAVGVALVVIGFFGLLEALNVDLSILFDYWYILLMGFGGWLVFNGLKARREEEPAESSDFD